MTIEQFINDNREEIDTFIDSPYKDDEERELWVLNDEYLYNLALESGVEDI